MNSTQFTHKAAEKKCPSCGEPYRLAGGYLFCEREHGTRLLVWVQGTLPVAARTAYPGRFAVAGMDGAWRLAAHRGKELDHAGPPSGGVIASIKRYGCTTPTAVVLVRGKSPSSDRLEKRYRRIVNPGGVFAEALKEARKAGLGPAIITERTPSCVLGCDRRFKSRGLCEVCYREAIRAIRKRETTWGELEDYGLAVKGNRNLARW